MNGDNDIPDYLLPLIPPRGPWQLRQGAFLPVVWLGTAAAGAVFGFIMAVAEFPQAALFGAGFGFFYAVVFGVPIQASVSILTWAFWLSKFRIVTAAIGGGVTGVAATISLGVFAVKDHLVGYVVLPGVLGALGAGLVAMYYDRERLFRNRRNDPKDKPPWQFTLSDLLVRVTVLAMLMSFWTCVFRVFQVW